MRRLARKLGGYGIRLPGRQTRCGSAARCDGCLSSEEMIFWVSFWYGMAWRLGYHVWSFTTIGFGKKHPTSFQ